MDPAWLGVIIPVAVAAGTALAGVLTNRRTGSGRVKTSDADALWTQTQKMLDNMQQRLNREQHKLERAEDQRDKLMDLQEQQTMPMLEAIIKSQNHILGLITEFAGRIERMDKGPPP